MVKLKYITKDNFEDVLNLKVSESQKNFVSSIVHSLAQAWVYKETAFPFSIYEDDTLIGFVMLGYYEVNDQYTLWKFMIDEKYQGRGYGRKALKLAIDYLICKFNVKEIYTGVAFKNQAAKNLYRSFGFKETGKSDESQLEMKLEL